MRRLHLLILTILIFSVLFGSCSHRQTVNIYTDNPGLLAAGELFNRQELGYTVLFHYSNNIEADLKEKVQPDLVVGEYLNSSRAEKNYVSFGKDFPVQNIYPFLFCDSFENPRLMPLSFSLPVILSKKENLNDFKNPVLTDLDEIREKSISFSNTPTYRLHMGFSPLWDDSFLFHTISVFSPDFRMRKDGPEADMEGIDKSVEYIRNWSIEAGSDVENSIAFSDRFRIIPDDELLMEGRIGFSYCYLNDLFNLSLDEKESFGFRYLSEEGKISPERVVYAAIPKRARNKKGARAFVRWILDPEVQKEILERQQLSGGKQTGFLIGFSSSPQINEEVLPQIYPMLNGFVPASRFFREVEIVPGEWRNLKYRVIIPWYRDRILNNSDVSLSDYYNEWILHAIVE